MKKWGPRKPLSPPSCFIFSISWLSKLMQIKRNSTEEEHFGGGLKQKKNLRSAWCDSNKGSEDTWQYNGLFGELPESEAAERKRDRKWGKTNQKTLELERKYGEAQEEKDIVGLENSRNLRFSCSFEALNLDETDEKLISEWELLKGMKIKEKKTSKGEKKRKQSSKVRVHSPRAASRHEHKKARDQRKAKGLAFGSFAMMKSSNDPQGDFRDSMMEMIIKKAIRSPEELEELLACYLTLNADEYHELIIQVFWHVLSELS